MPFLDIPLSYCYFEKDFQEECPNTYVSGHSSTTRYTHAEENRREEEHYS